MIHFFKKIRKNLTDKGKSWRYLKYAIGEILLIFIGILAALQFQNWNIDQQQEDLFKATLEEVYNTLNIEVQQFNEELENIKVLETSLDSILNHRDLLSAESLIFNTYLVSTPLQKNRYHLSQFSNNISYNPSKKVHRELALDISKYATNLFFDNQFQSNQVFNMLQEEGIAYPRVRPNNMVFEDNLDYYTEKDIEKMEALLVNDAFIARLKLLKPMFYRQSLRIESRRSDAESLIKEIRNYFPEVRILYKDISILGPSLDGWDTYGGKDYAMIEVDFDRLIWQTEVYLKEGELKFRSRQSWARNWGGNEFPEGRARLDGPNIQIPRAGTYRITLNLSENSYSFELLEED